MKLASLKNFNSNFNLDTKAPARGCATSYLPVLVLWLERHQGALLAARQDVLWRGAVDLLQLGALLLSLATIWTHKDKAFVTLRWQWQCIGLVQVQSVVPPRSPSVKILRKESELQSTPLYASDGSKLFSRSLM